MFDTAINEHGLGLKLMTFNALNDKCPFLPTFIC